MKRAREEDTENSAEEAVEPEVGALKAEETAAAPDPYDDEDEEDERFKRERADSKRLRKGADCPYVDTVARPMLDFDFEKCCSVSLSPINVYACLVCGKYFQGRGPKSHAYTHSLEFNHHMYMKVETGKVYCLPEGYEVDDRSFDDIRFVLNPRFSAADVSEFDKTPTWSRSLEGVEFMPGFVGLNNMRANDYANVIIQTLMRITPIRDFFLLPENYSKCKSLLVHRFGELMRKMWNPRNFKGQVSPHEFMQAVMQSSKKRFLIDKQGEPVEFFSWLANTLHYDLTGGKVKKRSVITDCLQGQLQMPTEAGTGCEL
ncbi:hypothetical protein CYMTET_31537 [Cymbomonas tetramitiformis]|uniref:Uncharacterized protein n=1 Tax=Cymbomonas tetramitiformis TaxID=36881 RepID=A0AAE0FGM3_9CHLO|nr:hypothetical protein CYMTET_31537 [Cymbomonas tetramitiformis]